MHGLRLRERQATDCTYKRVGNGSSQITSYCIHHSTSCSLSVFAMKPVPLLPAGQIEINEQYLTDAERLENTPLLEPVSIGITSLPQTLGQFRDKRDSAHVNTACEAATANHAAEPPQYAKKDFLHGYIPSTDPSDPRAQTFRNRISERKNMLRLQLGLSAAVAVINIVIFIWLWTSRPPVRGTGTLFTGDCTLASFLNTGSHIVLNLLSTGFLEAGNYCMQVLASPSREEIGTSHKYGNSLDIGIQSIFNPFHIHWKKRLIWVAMAIVSTILHLM